MKYRLDKNSLLEELHIWNKFLKRKVHLIACGGTAFTLLGVKESTLDIDLLIPKWNEYKYLIKLLQDLGYQQKRGMGWSRSEGPIFDLFGGNKIHTTELLESPLKPENNILIKEFSYIYLGVLNFYDILISKLFRGTTADIYDCLSLIRVKKQEIDINFFKNRFLETASYDISFEKYKKHLNHFLNSLKKETNYGDGRPI